MNQLRIGTNGAGAQRVWATHAVEALFLTHSVLGFDSRRALRNRVRLRWNQMVQGRMHLWLSQAWRRTLMSLAWAVDREGRLCPRLADWRPDVDFLISRFDTHYLIPFSEAHGVTASARAMLRRDLIYCCGGLVDSCDALAREAESECRAVSFDELWPARSTSPTLPPAVGERLASTVGQRGAAGGSVSRLLAFHDVLRSVLRYWLCCGLLPDSSAWNYPPEDPLDAALRHVVGDLEAGAEWTRDVLARRGEEDERIAQQGRILWSRLSDELTDAPHLLAPVWDCVWRWGSAAREKYAVSFTLAGADANYYYAVDRSTGHRSMIELREYERAGTRDLEAVARFLAESARRWWSLSGSHGAAAGEYLGGSLGEMEFFARASDVPWRSTGPAITSWVLPGENAQYWPQGGTLYREAFLELPTRFLRDCNPRTMLPRPKEELRPDPGSSPHGSEVWVLVNVSREGGGIIIIRGGAAGEVWWEPREPENVVNNPNTDLLIIAPLREEAEAVLSLLADPRRWPSAPGSARVYHTAQLSTGEKVVVTPIARGRVAATQAATEAIDTWRPRYVLLVGIAGGMAANEVGIGDVLVADQVVDYELQRSTPEGARHDWQVYRADPGLLNRARCFEDGNWHTNVQGRPSPGTPRVHFGPICSGDKVDASGFSRDFLDTWPRLIGIEMEASGVAAAAHSAATHPGFFMVRGVSDLADAKKDSPEVLAWRDYACRVAASFLIALLEAGPGASHVPGVGRNELMMAMGRYFTLEEIRGLCFRLGIKADDIPGETLSCKVTGLIEYVENRDRYEQLVKVVLEARPNLHSRLLRSTPE